MLASIVGGGLIGGAVMAAGRIYSKRFKEREEQLRQFRTAILALDIELTYLKNTLDWAMLSVARHEPAKTFMKTVVDNFEYRRMTLGREILHPGEAWMTAIELMKPKMALNAEDWALLETYGHTLGQPDIETGVKFTQYIVSQLEIQEKKARDERHMEKVTSAVGALAGTLVFIVLI